MFCADIVLRGWRGLGSYMVHFIFRWMWYYGILETLPKDKAILEQGIRAAQNYCSCFECI